MSSSLNRSAGSYAGEYEVTLEKIMARPDGMVRHTFQITTFPQFVANNHTMQAIYSLPMSAASNKGSK